jgi:hypothetical protein
MQVGGDKGHPVETITGVLQSLYKAIRWKMIPKCPGRYTCRDHDKVSHFSPTALLQAFEMDCPVAQERTVELDLPGRNDLVIATPMDEANTVGLITYVKKEGETVRYVHTLNTPCGFRRKLEAIGVYVDDSSIRLAEIPL